METILLSLRSLCAILILTFSFQTGYTQVFTNFESGTIESWRAEGDGDLVYNATGGNPTGCLQVNDDATGSLLLTIVPVDYLGDWSAASTSDFIQFDMFPHVISGTVLSIPWVVELSNDNNRAIIDSGYAPIFEAWSTLNYPLDPAAWTILEGNWSDLMDNVGQIRIRTEYINGDEWVRIDNFGLSFNPIFPVLNQIQCSNFENGLDGWSATGSGAVSIDATIGNPGSAVRINDALGPTSLALAPTKYLGDWSLLNGTGILGYDMQLTNFSGALITTGWMIELVGPGGTARMPQDPDVNLAFNNWHRFEYLLDSSLWTMTSGTWAGLLARVDEVKIRAEFINGTERFYMDNFCLGNPCGNAPTNLTSTVSPAGILLDWDSQVLEGVIGYRLSGGPVGGGVGARFIFEPASEIIFPAGSLPPGTYQWNVIGGCAVDGSLLTPVSVTETFVVPMAKLAPTPAELFVYPNPATDEVIYFNEQLDIRLFSVNGEMIREGHQVNQLEISGLPAGIYLLMDGKGRSTKLFIEKN